MKLTRDTLDPRQTQKHQQLASSNEQITNQSINSTPSLTYSILSLITKPTFAFLIFPCFTF